MGKKVIYCNCQANIISRQKIEEIERIISEGEMEAVKVSDLCGLAANQKDEVETLFSYSDGFLVIACYSRAVKLLLEYAGVNIDAKGISLINLREEETINIHDLLKLYIRDQKSFQEIKSNPEWPAWYPVIDHSKCTVCGQCADFCLFGVYQKTGEKINVVNPQACKNNCPACARICPQTAIVFPKYKLGGAIAGSDVFNLVAEQQRQRQDMDEILGSDIYQALEQRKLKRQAIIKSEAMKRALEERDKALNEKK